jgi:hypothetical protein
MAKPTGLMRGSALFLALMLAGPDLVAQGKSRPCLRYEPDTTQITGVLARHMYYGGPGYGEDPKHDEKEVGFYLDLTVPLCMTAGSDFADVATTGIRRVQLVLDEGGYARLRSYLGKLIALRGMAFGAYTGHHHTPVLLDVLKPVRVGRPL